MRPVLRLLSYVTVVAFAPFSVSEAFAHIDLIEPEARAHGTAARGDTDVDANSNLKQGPCGQIVAGRTDRVATYRAGETITVRVREENAHVSYLRVSIDLDGEDFPLRAEVPAGPETQEEAAAAEAALDSGGLLAVYREDNDMPGFVHELEVTLPGASCDSCTLQVLQHMYDDPSAPYYFQCADLVIVGEDDAPDAGGQGTPGSTPTDGAAGSDGTAPLGGGNAGVMAPPSTPDSVGDDAPGVGEGSSDDAVNTPVNPGAPGVGSRSDGGGCQLSPRNPSLAPVAGLVWLSLGVGFVRRRRARNAQRGASIGSGRLRRAL